MKADFYHFLTTNVPLKPKTAENKWSKRKIKRNFNKKKCETETMLMHYELMHA